MKNYASFKRIVRSFQVKFITSVFLAVIIYYSGGYYLCFRLIQNHIRKEVKARVRRKINESDLTIVELTSRNVKEIKWVRKGREFTYHHQLYDVVNFRISGHRILIKCLNDKTEQSLISHYMQHSRAVKILQQLHKVFCYKMPQQALSLVETIFKVSAVPVMSGIVSADLSIPAPPPRFI